MKKQYFIIIFLALSGICILHAQSTKGYHLVWSDEFNGTSLDTTSWSYQTGHNGWGNHELEDYTKGKNVQVKDGTLTIIARKEGSVYTSGRICTKGKRTFTYGLIEIRAKLPQGTGTWPALWMLGTNEDVVGWPACGELDIMEHVGKDPGYIHTSIHNTSGYGATPYTGIIYLKDPFTKYHVYGMDWTKEYIRFLVDGKLVYQYAPNHKTAANWPFDKPSFFIFNVAIGGDWGGPVIDNSIFPQTMVVDYVRVYQKNK